MSFANVNKIKNEKTITMPKKIERQQNKKNRRKQKTIQKLNQVLCKDNQNVTNKKKEKIQKTIIGANANSIHKNY